MMGVRMRIIAFSRMLCGLLIFAACSTSHASNWIQAAGDNNGTSIWLDTMSVHFAGSHAKAWLMFDYQTDQTIQGTYPAKSARSLKELDLFNCDQGTSVTVQVLWTSMTNGAGEVVYSNSIPPETARYTDVVPDSVGEAILNAVCSRRSKRGSSM